MCTTEDPQSARPDATAVKNRAFILLHIFRKALVTPPESFLARFAAPSMDDEKAKLVSGFQEMFAKQNERLRASSLWKKFEANEQEFMDAGIFETTTRQRVDAGWLAESIMCLLWALGCRTEMIPYDQQASPFSRSDKAQSPDQLTNLIKQAALRPQPEIDTHRDWAELWHWRARTHTLLATKKIPDTLPDGTFMTEVIRLTAVKAAAEGAFPQPVENDFPAFGKPFRQVSEEELSQLTSIAMERHKAFNWLCGTAPANRWSETPTDT
jgi:hypothetical protein